MSEPLLAQAEPGLDEPSLVRDALRGERGAFDEIVRTHHRRVFNFLYQMTRQRQDAEDLTQQTFIKAFAGLERFDVSRPMIHWLLTIGRHAALNHFRSDRKWQARPEAVAATERSPAEIAEERDQAESVWARARRVLGQREFEVIWLRYGEDLSVAETARVVGLTETHVKVLLYRARQALLEKNGEEQL